MTTFKNIKIGDEVEFLNSSNQLETSLVNYIDDKKFSVDVLRYNKFKNEWYYTTLAFYLKSGKKTNRFYNYGDATRIVNKWSELTI